MSDLHAIARRFGLTAAQVYEIADLLRPAGDTVVDMDLDDDASPYATWVDVTDPGKRAAEPSRYEDLGLIGTGGMAEVRAVRDNELGRVLAMKIIAVHLQNQPGVVERFVEEAQATAQLEHPGIVPVHDMGRLPDGRRYFTMKKIRGDTLTVAIRGVHEASDRVWHPSESGFTLRRLVDAFRRVCETVAHAHARGVIHRDLKPDNIMVGAFGEVLVLDWGLAKLLGAASRSLEAVQTSRSTSASNPTRIGTVAGTPVYMSPEQARGEVDKLLPASDVYALGAILYEILYGEAPNLGLGLDEILAAAATGPPDPLPSKRPLPEDLVELWRIAMTADPAERLAHAGLVAERVTGWQEGARRRERAMQVVEEARGALPGLSLLRERARAYDVEARRQSRGLQSWQAVEDKRPVWEIEDEAKRLEADAEREELRITELLRAALTQAPELQEAHAMLADLYQARHSDAERRRDDLASARYEQLLRAHDSGRYAGWLQGTGAVSLSTDPEGAEVDLLAFAPRDRRLVPQLVRGLGRTPLRNVPLDHGSYLLLIRAPGCAEVRYPVDIGRQQHWDGLRPGDRAPRPVRLPRDGELGPDDVFVPGGWFVNGGDPDAPTGPSRRQVWVDPFVIRRHPVTNAEYLAFLDGLVAEGREELALACAPRERAAGDAEGPQVYGRLPDGGFTLRRDADGDAWDPAYPVLLIDWNAAAACAAWMARTTGVPWRLPGELEWEKAARGVDGRFFPWGDFLDPTWARLRVSVPSRPLPAKIGATPTDESPYGVRGMAGNACDWCADLHEEHGPRLDGPIAPVPSAVDSAAPRVNRGGAWSFDVRVARLCHRRSAAPDYRSETIGFRLARSPGS